MIKKIEIVAGMKYSAEISCGIEYMVEIPPLLRLSSKPTLAKAKILLNNTTITSVLVELEDLYKEQMKVYAKKVNKFEKDGMQAYLMVIGQCIDNMIYKLECNDDYTLLKSN